MVRYICTLLLSFQSPNSSLESPYVCVYTLLFLLSTPVLVRAPSIGALPARLLPALQRWRGHPGPAPASRVRCLLDIQDLGLLREIIPGSAARTKQLCIKPTRSDPQYSARAPPWEPSTLPSFSSFTTEGFAIKTPSYNTFNTQLYATAARLTPTAASPSAYCTVAQAHRLPLEPQCRLPREAANLIPDKTLASVSWKSPLPQPAGLTACLRTAQRWLADLR